MATVKITEASLRGARLALCASISGRGQDETLGALVRLVLALGDDMLATEDLVAAFLGASGVDALLRSGFGQRVGELVAVSLAPAKDQQRAAAGRARAASAVRTAAGVLTSGTPAGHQRDDQRATSDDSSGRWSAAGPPLVKSPAGEPAPVVGGRGGSVSDLGSSSDLSARSGLSAPLEPLVLIPGAITDPLPKRRARAGGGWTVAESQAAQRVWALQTKLRAEVIPGCRELAATPDRLQRISRLLRDGRTEEECAAVLRSVADRVRRDPSAAQWFNGETTWRPDNFDRELGKLGTTPGGDRRGPVNGFDHVRAALSKLHEAAQAEEAEEVG